MSARACGVGPGTRLLGECSGMGNGFGGAGRGSSEWAGIEIGLGQMPLRTGFVATWAGGRAGQGGTGKTAVCARAGQGEAGETAVCAWAGRGETGETAVCAWAGRDETGETAVCVRAGQGETVKTAVWAWAGLWAERIKGAPSRRVLPW